MYSVQCYTCYIVDDNRLPTPSFGIAVNNTTDLPLLPRLVTLMGDGITDDMPSSKNSSKPITRVRGVLFLLDLLVLGPAVDGRFPLPFLLGRCPLARINFFRCAFFLFSDGVMNLLAANRCEKGIH